MGIEFAALAEHVVEEHVTVVRLTTSYWSDDKGINVKKTLRYLKRQCRHGIAIEDEISASDTETATKQITNLYEVADGIYELECNYVSNFGGSLYSDDEYDRDYQYTLVPWKETGK